MPNRVLSFHYTLKDDKGTTIETSQGQNPLSIIEGRGQVIPKLEVQLVEMKPGEKKSVDVASQEAYGSYDDTLVRKVKIKDMPKKDVKIGDEFEVSAGGRKTLVMVTRVAGEEVTLDGNHPLAGKDLTFEIELTESRDATAEELSHGHVHGPGGHEH